MAAGRGTAAASQRRLLYPKLFISNGIVTRVSVWYLTFRDTRTLGELLFRDEEKGSAHRQETTTSRHPFWVGFLLMHAEICVE